MTPSAIEQELLKVTKIKAKAGEARATFLNRLLDAGQGLDDDQWHALTDEAQNWYNSAVRGLQAANDVADIPDPSPEEAIEADPDGAEGADETVTEEAAEAPPPAATKARPPVKPAKPAAKAVAAKKAPTPPPAAKKPPSPPPKAAQRPPSRAPAKPAPKIPPKPAPKAAAKVPPKPAPTKPAAKTPPPAKAAPVAKSPPPAKTPPPAAANAAPTGSATSSLPGRTTSANGRAAVNGTGPKVPISAQTIVKRLLIRNINAEAIYLLAEVRKYNKDASKLTISQVASDFRHSVRILQEAKLLGKLPNA